MLKYYDKETKTLTIPYKFNKELKDIPEEIETIFFGYYYNKSVDNLANNLTHLTLLTFGKNFNQTVNNLPKNLTHLTFGYQTPVRLAHPKIMNIFIII
jgi:hypothetical protein